MIKRVVVAVALGAAALGVSTIPASAANQTVQIVAAGVNCSAIFCYVPAVQQSSQGDTVTWSNASPDVHTVTRCTAAACGGQDGGTGADTLDSGGNVAASTGTYNHTFNGAGTYYYYCALHGYSVMHGEVVVAAAPAAAAPEVPATALLVVAAGLVLGVALLRRRRSAAAA